MEQDIIEYTMHAACNGTAEEDYGDIINMAHHVSETRPYDYGGKGGTVRLICGA